MEFLETLHQEWKVISEAPWSFALAVAAAAALIWLLEVRFLSQRLRLKEDEIADYKRKLDGASPEEAARRMQELEGRVAATEEAIQRDPSVTPLGEEGENANGRYKRYRDGTQVCSFEFIPDAGAHSSPDRVLFPATFSDRPIINMHPEGTAVILRASANGFAYQLNQPLKGRKLRLSYSAVGRWDA